MDLRCPICGEPWDFDCLHEVEGKSFQQAWREFKKRGCAVLGEKCEPSDSFPAQAARAAYAMMGDDPDGCAAMLDEVEDWE